MQVTVTSADGDNVVQLSVEATQSVGSITMRLQEQFGVAAASQVLLHNGNPLRLDQTFGQAGVQDDDLVVLVNNPSSAPAPARSTIAPPSAAVSGARAGMRLEDIPGNATPELWLAIIELNPGLLDVVQQANSKLADALRTKSVAEVRMAIMQMHMEKASHVFKAQEEARALELNPFDAAAQAQIEERIRLSNVQSNMEIAMEEMPEAFGQVFMLYVPCEVNGTKVKAFVDSGAQSTIMSSGCAERCGIMRLVDKRFAGQAVGVGTAKIIGRVHMAPLKIGEQFYNCSFTILDQQSVDFLFGLDMLKRHQCAIDLSKNELRLHGVGGVQEVPFLPEHEIPVSGRPAPHVEASAASSAPLAAAAPSAGSSPASGGESHQEKVQRLVALGFAEQQTEKPADTMADEFRVDLYDVLGLDPGAEEKEVARAYKKKSLKHHPDRGGDVKKFIELKHARDILLDPKKKTEYDKKLSHELMAKKKQREREAELDSKRRQMRDELLQKERGFELQRKREAPKYSKNELTKLREKGLARQQELQEKLAREARRREELDELKGSLAANQASKSKRTVTFKWDRKQHSHSDETLSRELRSYGEIEQIKLKPASAKVIFAEASAAASVVRVEAHKTCWRSVSLQGHIVEAEDVPAEASSHSSHHKSTTYLPSGPISLSEHLAFEKLVLETLRERAKLQQQATQRPMECAQ